MIFLATSLAVGIQPELGSKPVTASSRPFDSHSYHPYYRRVQRPHESCIGSIIFPLTKSLAWPISRAPSCTCSIAGCGVHTKPPDVARGLSQMISGSDGGIAGVRDGWSGPSSSTIIAVVQTTWRSICWDGHKNKGALCFCRVFRVGGCLCVQLRGVVRTS